MSNGFNTVSKPVEAEFKDRGSKFICYAYRVDSKDEVRERLKELAEIHPAARHFCYAYQIGPNAEEYRANDDGEPSGSAGLPILNQIKSKELTNTLAVVVRYFGGTKLGVSGLINAYKEATKLALDKAKIILEIPKVSVQLKFPHSRIGDVERIIRQNNWEVVDQKFGLDCEWKIRFPEFEKENGLNQFKPFENVQPF
jgi:uncharacterized YigZ family protein